MKKQLKFLMPYLPSVICMAVIFIFSAQTAENSSTMSDSVVEAVYGNEYIGSHSVTLFVRKAAHFLEYSLLGALLYIGNIKALNKSTGVCVIIAAALAGLYAVTDEIHQYFVPGRACMLSDVILDFCGSLTGASFAAGIILLYSRIKRNNIERNE